MTRGFWFVLYILVYFEASQDMLGLVPLPKLQVPSFGVSALCSWSFQEGCRHHRDQRSRPDPRWVCMFPSSTWAKGPKKCSSIASSCKGVCVCVCLGSLMLKPYSGALVLCLWWRVDADVSVRDQKLVDFHAAFSLKWGVQEELI